MTKVFENDVDFATVSYIAGTNEHDRQIQDKLPLCYAATMSSQVDHLGRGYVVVDEKNLEEAENLIEENGGVVIGSKPVL